MKSYDTTSKGGKTKRTTIVAPEDEAKTKKQQRSSSPKKQTAQNVDKKSRERLKKSSEKTLLERGLNQSSVVELEGSIEYPQETKSCEKFRPVLYTFRMPLAPTEIRRGTAKSPPFWVQLDHTIGVIWCLFASNKMEKPYKPLGIVQLQWALTFLKSIHTHAGERPKDVATVIRVIQDKLIEQYADMLDDIEHMDDLNTSKEFQQQIALAAQLNDVSATQLLIETNAIPFSVNYTDMMKGSSMRLEMEHMYNSRTSSCCTDSELKTRNFGTTGSGGVIDVPAHLPADKEQIAAFLKEWRQEQVDNIEEELKRLHEIEAYMEKLDRQDLVDEKEMNVLVASKLTRTTSNPNESKKKRDKSKSRTK